MYGVCTSYNGRIRKNVGLYSIRDVGLAKFHCTYIRTIILFIYNNIYIVYVSIYFLLLLHNKTMHHYMIL